jgi:hypothetical protein
MHFVAPFVALFAAVAFAAQNAINIPPGGLIITANVPTTITWSDPSSGTVTIKLQQGAGVTSETGLIVDSGVEASALTATFIIPGNQVNDAQYNFEIIDDTNSTNVNFSTGFTIAGASMTGTVTPGTASATGSAATSSLPSVGTASTTVATSTATESSNSSASSKSAAASSAQPSSQPTTVTNNNGAGSLKIQGGLLAAIAGVIAVF